MTTNMKIAIGSDHAATDLKKRIIELLKERNCQVEDLGTHGKDSVDYPDFGEKVSDMVSRGEVDRGILICGTGIGMSIVANKFPGVRASLCNDAYAAKMSRLHNNANLLILPGRMIDSTSAKEIVSIWFTTSFEGGRHQRRIDKIKAIEERLKCQ